MQKIEVVLDSVRDEILKFYDEKVWHFLTINGVGLDDEKLEVQWIFSKYEAMDEVVIYFANIDYKDVVPSVVDIVPSAIISQRELVDMFGIEVEGSDKGLYLDEDSLQMPLSSCRMKQLDDLREQKNG
ncbi:MAG: NADH-quinone oxidoreductase subunit C [Campylobacterota bacterium]|nr:NADH-quinone oxidoreductase subunit C [Campylobacterota bacterium]